MVTAMGGKNKQGWEAAMSDKELWTGDRNRQ